MISLKKEPPRSGYIATKNKTRQAFSQKPAGYPIAYTDNLTLC